MDDHARSNLALLADELKRRNWPTQISRTGGRLTLKVANPADEQLNESVTCSAGDDGPVYRIVGGQVLGAASEDIKDIADRLQNVLRSVGA